MNQALAYIPPGYATVSVYFLQIMLSRINLSKWQPELTSITDNAGRSPLHWAAAAGRRENLRILLEHPKLEMNIDQSDSAGRTPIMWAISSSNSAAIDCVQLILAKAPWSTSVQVGRRRDGVRGG